MSAQPSTNLERQIRSQPDELSHLLTSEKIREQIHAAAEGLQRARRIWLVGTGTSHHAAILGAGMLQDAGSLGRRRCRRCASSSGRRSSGPDDTIIVITHTGETAYALAARALATTAGLDVITITRRGAPFPHSVETCARETSETYTVSYTTTLLVLAMIAKEMGADSITDDTLALVPGAVRNAIESSGTESIQVPERALDDRGRRTRGVHRSGGRAQASGGRARAGRGARHRVPAARFGRPARRGGMPSSAS